MMKSETRADTARRIEMHITLDALRNTGASLKEILEIGCGTGVQSRVLSGVAHRVVATEFEGPHPASHAKGIREARRRLVGVSHISFALADATQLPFRTGSFDVVYSCAVLEHVQDRNQALREMARVVRPSGLVVAIVPTSLDTLAGYLRYYAADLPRMARDRWKSRLTSPAPAPPAALPPAPGGLSRIIRRLAFPVHGWYATRRQELCECRPSRWRALFRDNGFHIAAAFAVRFPLQQLFPRMFQRTERLTSRVGSTPLQVLGSAYAIIARPPPADRREARG